MKKTYIVPKTLVAFIAEELPIAQSNRVNENSIILNSNTMGTGNGTDAVKSNDVYNVWDDDWSR